MKETSRRTFLLAGLGVLAGCSATSRQSVLPAVPWDDVDPGYSAARTQSATVNVRRAAEPTPLAPPPGMDGLLSRARWATCNPIPSRMDRMTPISRITIHHDGMSPCYDTSRQACAGRIELICRAHQSRGWGDIGYHYVVDRSGRVWEARPLAYQGAHVKYNNPGNVGIVCLGNFDRQSPSEVQLRALTMQIRRLQRIYHVKTSNVFTHQELRPTACPGRTLQQCMVAIRSNGKLG